MTSPLSEPSASKKIPRRVLTAVMNSVAAGVTPRTGIEHLAVGRKEEIDAIATDLDNVGEAGAVFRIISGSFGSGKTFLLQLARNYALERNYVVMDADLSPERRLTGTQGQGLATYRELTKNMATRTRPDGGALATILEKWISGVQADVIQEQGLTTADPTFASAVERKIFDTVNSMEGLVHGFDFSQVLATYWRGYTEQDESKRTAALRWLRGEYATKTEARESLGGTVRVMIDDDAWYDYIKLLAQFVSAIGYKGLIVIVDEGVNLFKITHTQARLANYEKLLTILNDCLQGKAEHLGVLVGATPQMVEDTRRGLFSYDALRTRLQESRFAARADLRDMSGTVIKLEPLSFEEVYVLLQRLRHLHAVYHGYAERVSDAELKGFMEETLNRLGADRFTTPREIIRDFVAVLNLIQQNPPITFDSLVHGADYRPTAVGADTDVVTVEDADGEEGGGAAVETTMPRNARAGIADPEGSIDDKFKAFKL
jgi:hypothetical protein